MNKKIENNISYYSYATGLFSVIVILLWLGVFKFTSAEAEAIKPLVENHILMGWIYSILPTQTVSNLIGTAEIFVGIALIVGLKYPKIGVFAGILASVIFITTTSFIFTTPGVFKIIEGIPKIDFFLFKDIALFGFSMMYVAKSMSKLSIQK
ncbi:MAG: putative membrane protein YkgB [Francisella sp.]|jgi:uncharacterized membrane protein YkgB